MSALNYSNRLVIAGPPKAVNRFMAAPLDWLRDQFDIGDVHRAFKGVRHSPTDPKRLTFMEFQSALPVVLSHQDWKKLNRDSEGLVAALVGASRSISDTYYQSSFHGFSVVNRRPWRDTVFSKIAVRNISEALDRLCDAALENLAQAQEIYYAVNDPRTVDRAAAEYAALLQSEWYDYGALAFEQHRLPPSPSITPPETIHAFAGI